LFLSDDIFGILPAFFLLLSAKWRGASHSIVIC
jgi:hypothetical protein